LARIVPMALHEDDLPAENLRKGLGHVVKSQIERPAQLADLAAAPIHVGQAPGCRTARETDLLERERQALAVKRGKVSLNARGYGFSALKLIR